MSADNNNEDPTHDDIVEYLNGGHTSADRAKIAAFLLKHPQALVDAKRIADIEKELRRLADKELQEPLSPKLQAFLDRIRDGD